MTVTVTYPRAGQIDPEYEKYVETMPANSGDGGIAAGLIGTVVTGKVVVNPTGATGVKPFVGVVETKLTGDTQVRVLQEGIFYGYAEGAIAVGSQLVGGTVTAGHMKARAAETFDKIIGPYRGHPGEGSGNSPITAGANGQIIRVYIQP
jgi:hypothetical protein